MKLKHRPGGASAPLPRKHGTRLRQAPASQRSLPPGGSGPPHSAFAPPPPPAEGLSLDQRPKTSVPNLCRLRSRRRETGKRRRPVADREAFFEVAAGARPSPLRCGFGPGVSRPWWKRCAFRNSTNVGRSSPRSRTAWRRGAPVRLRTVLSLRWLRAQQTLRTCRASRSETPH